MHTFPGPGALQDAVGTHLGHSDWLTVTQAQVDQFADATGDHQWIHTDPARAADGPYSGTVAHGYLVLALLPRLVTQVLAVDGVRLRVNYGLEKVRFPAPLRVGDAVRAGVEVAAVREVPGGLHLELTVTVEPRGGGKPCCVASTVTRLYV
ncbi:MaoC family dehydratase [Pilimelia terevasa]|uniref:MaoC family dehydratase n=1 Tax=Pilimelia terevasa TaxID=53372 RepID=A0A8J3FGJ2_9ACTN|nr:MaoC family dehydratase [Pilimelia terevasa]GGK17299.1 MaoC family dehydratase [Pilimelia terevasa]